MASDGSTGDELDELAARAATGDRSAVEQLGVHLDPMLHRYCRARIGRANGGYEAADDVAQEAYVGVCTALPGWLDKNYPFKMLAYRIASNKVADYYRRRTAHRSVPIDGVPEQRSGEPSPEKATLDRELADHAQGLLNGLSSLQRDVLILRVMEGISTAETARIVGSTPGSVRITQHRALAKLRSALERSLGPIGP